MYKKVRFVVHEREWRYDIVETVLTNGYAFGMVANEYESDEEKGLIKDNKTVLEFMCHRYDLQDLRHDLEVLQKAGFNVKEVEAQ